jgi:hypothetical protein
MFVCDDVAFSITGKINVTGIFTNDIIIPFNPTPLPQVSFLFAIDFPLEKGYAPVAIEIQLPKEPDPRIIPLPKQDIVFLPGRTRRSAKIPYLLQNAVVHCGKIEAHIVCEEHRVYAGRMWVNTQDTFAELLKNAGATPSGELGTET